jgi:PLP dependent protein
MGNIKDRYYIVLAEIEKKASACNRKVDEITLVVVTKTHPIQKIIEAYEAGVRNIGENYVEEAIDKIDQVGSTYNVNWHMIGHIQSRKTTQVVSRFSAAHSIDRIKTARRLNEASYLQEKIFPIFLECNVSGEETKFGWPAWDTSSWYELADSLAPIFSFSNIKILGLMTMAPYSHDPEDSRSYFNKLRKLGGFLENHLKVCLPGYSMGMSGDYQVAIEEGATHLRIGSAIMGTRP